MKDRGSNKGTGPEVDMNSRCSSSRRKSSVAGHLGTVMGEAMKPQRMAAPDPAPSVKL